MSKSAESDMSRINLLDDPATVRTKVQKAKTDAFTGLEFGNPDRPEAHNLLSIYHLVTGMSKVMLANPQHNGKGPFWNGTPSMGRWVSGGFLSVA